MRRERGEVQTGESSATGNDREKGGEDQLSNRRSGYQAVAETFACDARALRPRYRSPA